ncbi:hypothetical protein [Mesorhizobium sp. M1216]|uniref:ATP-binding protein n=1 Tax=Mesorhizobium sp. M1216 TaxID=2957069 RepID=UPI00333938E6
MTVSVRADETIAIVNAGPVVPLPDLEAIRGRGRRDATLTAGSGQGLLTAKYAIKKIGGSLEFASLPQVARMVLRRLFESLDDTGLLQRCKGSSR